MVGIKPGFTARWGIGPGFTGKVGDNIRDTSKVRNTTIVYR